ncbi:glycosyltransferase family 9 protein [Thiohalospira sp.]|uniref:glycosyltransferase family 9 protein n=1 Tax=Thiohalospira sp. TaxID=3080549 RepID=UPI003981430C
MTAENPSPELAPGLFQEPPDSLCLLRLSAIGDTTHLVPAVRTLQRAWPQTRLTWIIGGTEAKLLGDLDGVEMIPFKKGSGLAGYRDLRRRLGHRRFDALALMQVALRAGGLSTAVRAPLRLGFDRARSRDGHGAFINRRIAPHPRAHVLEGFFDFLRALGVHQRHLVWDIPVPEPAGERARQLIPDDRPALVISPCSSQRINNFRNWSPEAYAAVAEHAHRAHGLQTVLTGGPTDEERRYAEAITGLADAPVTDCIGATDLKELLALLGRAEAVLCPDSGPAHMATAAGTPVIGLYATSNPDRTGPYLSRRWVVNRYPDALRRTLGKGVDEVAWGQRVRDPAAMDLITVADVTDRLDELLATPADQRLAPPPG